MSGEHITLSWKAEPALSLMPGALFSPLGVSLTLGALVALALAVGAWWRARQRALRLTEALALFEAERATARGINRQLEQQIDARNAELKQSLAALREAHQHLVQSERMAALGQFSSAVAHEINNPLAFVHSNLRFLQDMLRDAKPLTPPDGNRVIALSTGDHSECEAVVRESLEGTSRLASIVADLKMLSQREEAPTCQVDVRHALELALRLARTHLGPAVQVVRELEEVPAVEAHVGRLAQVFFNLLLNASHALAQAQGPARRIRLRCFPREVGQVVAEVEDTGSGIPEHVRQRLFEPFFTTRPPGQGRGLGLSVARGIVRSFNGEIEFESQEGRGTIFRVVLPTADSRASARGVEAE